MTKLANTAAPALAVCILAGCQCAGNSAPRAAAPSVAAAQAVASETWGHLVPIRWLREDDTAVRGMAFSSDGKLLLTGWDSGAIRLWDVADGYKPLPGFDLTGLPKIATGAKWVCSYGVAFSPDNRLVLTGGLYADSHGRSEPWSTFADDAYVWDVGSRKLKWILKGHQESVLKVAFSPDGKSALTASSDGTVAIWSVETGKLLRTFHGRAGQNILAMAISPDGKRVACGDGGGGVYLWNFKDCSKISYTNIDGVMITHLAFRPDGKILAICGLTHDIWIWNFRHHPWKSLFREPIIPFEAAAFTSDGKYLISSGTREDSGADQSPESYCLIWISEVATGKMLFQSPLLHKGVASIVIAPDGKSFASSSNDGGGVTIWNMPKACQPHG